MQLGYPLRFDARGRTTDTDEEAHVHDLIAQVLFIAPGERVNRPDFGSGLMQLVFAPSGDELATATQFLVQGALQRWLGDVIQVEAIDVKASEATLAVTVSYRLVRNGERRVVELSRETGT